MKSTHQPYMTSIQTFNSNTIQLRGLIWTFPRDRSIFGGLWDRNRLRIPPICSVSFSLNRLNTYTPPFLQKPFQQRTLRLPFLTHLLHRRSALLAHCELIASHVLFVLPATSCDTGLQPGPVECIGEKVGESIHRVVRHNNRNNSAIIVMFAIS